MNLEDLPVEMIDYILSFVPYEEVAKLRAVDRFFNLVCSYRLNQGFSQVEKFHSRCLKDIKAKLPRRESERKNHPLSRHSDMMMATESRLSMLSMTFSKYIECEQCCFIPGKVLDEAMRLLRAIKDSYTSQAESDAPVAVLPRPHEFLQEFRDLSSMAIEYFDEKILPEIKERIKHDNLILKNEYKKKHNRRFFIQKVDLGNAPIRYAIRQAKTRKNSDDCSSPIPMYKITHFVKQNRKKCNMTKKFLEVLNTKVNALASALNSHSILIQQQKNTLDDLSRTIQRTRKMWATRAVRSKLPLRAQLNLEKKVEKALTTTGLSSIQLPGSEQPSGSQGRLNRHKKVKKALTTHGVSCIHIPGNEDSSGSQGTSSSFILVPSQQPSLVLNHDTTSSAPMIVDDVLPDESGGEPLAIGNMA